MPAEASMTVLIANSSLGTPAARRVRSRTPKSVTANIAAASRAESRGKAGSIHRSSSSGTTPLASKEKSTMAKSRRTGAAAAKAASKVLRDGRTSKASKAAAGSALSQRAPKKGRS